MKAALSRAKKVWIAFAVALGDLISSVFLVVFYYSIFALFAIPYRAFTGRFKAPKDSSWVPKVRQTSTLEDLKNEF